MAFSFFSNKALKTCIFNLLHDKNWKQVCIHRNTFTYLSEEIRSSFIAYYEAKHQHTHVPSSKVFSPKDDSLLFVNAGMNQFKSIFLDAPSPDDKFHNLKRAVNSQRCIRVGGKHNDLEAVGGDFHHHTLFEMLGSWSFGDYFKEDACKMAWQLLTEVFGLPVEKLYVTYFGGCPKLGLKADLETKEVWQSIGVPDNRILPFGAKENFWEMGETGPCGTCTEIHYDRLDGRHAPEEVNCDGSNVIEVWNLVFTQYNRLGPNYLEPLKTFFVDTGMGLERVTAIMQGKVSNYDTDLFQPIINILENLAKCRPYHGQIGPMDEDGIDTAYRIVSDHIRMLTVAVADGLFPGSRGRDLVVRRVLRRAVKAATENLKVERMFLKFLVPAVIDKLKTSYPMLHEKQSKIIETLSGAEHIYYDLIDSGDRTFINTVSCMPSNKKQFPIDVGIHLLSYQGYPQDRFMLNLEKHDKSIDIDQLEKFFEEKNPVPTEELEANEGQKLNFPQIIQELSTFKIHKTEICSLKYTKSQTSSVSSFNFITSKIVALVSDEGNIVKNFDNCKDQNVFVVLDKSCFVHPQGKKMKDVGNIMHNQDTYSVSEVHNVQGWFLHRICLCYVVTPKIGDFVQLCATTSEWLPMVRAIGTSSILESLLPDVVDEKTVQKIKWKQDYMQCEISGKLTYDEVLAIEKVIHNLILQSSTGQSQNDSLGIFRNSSVTKCCSNFLPRDLVDVVIVKHRHQGAGRTILHLVSGLRAVSAKTTLNILTAKVEDVTNAWSTMSLPNVSEVENLLRKVGALTYEVNKSEIHFAAKLKFKTNLSILSGRLNTLKRRITKKSIQGNVFP